MYSNYASDTELGGWGVCTKATTSWHESSEIINDNPWSKSELLNHHVYTNCVFDTDTNRRLGTREWGPGQTSDHEQVGMSRDEHK